MSDYLIHHGIKGQKWGVRRFQNEDGSVTPAGAERYYSGKKKYDKQIRKAEKFESKVMTARAKNRSKMESKFDKKITKYQKKIDSYDPIKEGLKDKKGRDILTKDDVQKSIDAIQKKLDDVTNRRKEAVTDWDDATDSIQKGFDKYKQTIKNYTDAIKMEDLDDTYGYSREYSDAVNSFISQRNSVVIYGMQQTILGYVAEEFANKQDKKQ